MSGFVVRQVTYSPHEKWSRWLTPRDENGRRRYARVRVDAEVFPTEKTANRAIPLEMGCTPFPRRHFVDPTN